MNLYSADRVSEILSNRKGLQRVLLQSGLKAYVLTDLLPECAVGDEVVVNTSAIDLDLGTGGWCVVHWNLSQTDKCSIASGHIMKLRYIGAQFPVRMIEETYSNDSEIHSRLIDRKVLVAGLHSHVCASAIAIKLGWPHLRVGYVMTDGGALPMALSDTVHRLKREHVIDVTITAGHAFGGDHESLTFAAAVAAAFEVENCDVVIVGMGPGVAGSGTQLGNTALEVHSISNTLIAMGATVSQVLRVSNADSRSRHTGLSHHSKTNLELTDTRTVIGVPANLDDAVLDAIKGAGHSVTFQECSDLLEDLLADERTPGSMGRSPRDDPDFYAFVCSAVSALMAN